MEFINNFFASFSQNVAGLAIYHEAVVSVVQRTSSAIVCRYNSHSIGDLLGIKHESILV
jgi:hypothetical protein